jgi:hypothetical protein
MEGHFDFLPSENDEQDDSVMSEVEVRQKPSDLVKIRVDYLQVAETSPPVSHE